MDRGRRGKQTPDLSVLADPDTKLGPSLMVLWGLLLCLHYTKILLALLCMEVTQLAVYIECPLLSMIRVINGGICCAEQRELLYCQAVCKLLYSWAGQELPSQKAGRECRKGECRWCPLNNVELRLAKSKRKDNIFCFPADCIYSSILSSCCVSKHSPALHPRTLAITVAPNWNSCKLYWLKPLCICASLWK